MKLLLKLFLFFIFIILIGVGIVFVRPSLLINPSNLKFVLNHTQILSEWSWKSARFEMEWKKWNQRRFAGEFKDFCFVKSSEGMNVKSCLEDISWDFDFTFDMAQGFHSVSLKPITIRSSFTNVTLTEGPKKDESTDPPNIKLYWNMFWSDIVPDMDFVFKKITLVKEKDDFTFDIKVTKFKEDLFVESLGFVLTGNPKELIVKAPEHYPIKKDLGTTRPLFLNNVKFIAHMQDKGIPMSLTGAVENVMFNVTANLALPLVDDLSSLKLRRDFFKSVQYEIKLIGLKDSLKRYAPEPFDELPAPFNSLSGNIISEGHFIESDKNSEVLLKSKTNFDLKSPKQSLILDITADLPINVQSFKRGDLFIGIIFHDVLIELPRLSKKSLPPQFFPDGRFKKISKELEKKKKKQSDLSMHLVAGSDQALVIKTNLLDEPLKLNFDINIEKSSLQDGFLKILPFKTKIFKRIVQLKDALINFKKDQDPVIKAQIQFPLPEYKINLFIEGPMSKPRYAFTSVPPLPQSDIYSVLLLGRPMEDLSNDDKSAVQKTNQVLSQGLLSLSTLYFLSGGPVEHIGYDPDSKNVSAQIGLSSKTSLRVGAGSEGLNSTSVRRSLGKGWYVDSSVQNSSNSVEQQNKDYGVLIERIISY